MTPEEMQTAVRQLVDKDAIVDLVHRYSFLFDHGRLEEVVRLFTPSCVIDYGPGIAPVIQGRIEFSTLLSTENPHAFLATSHHNANVLVTFDDADHAHVSTSLFAWHQAVEGPNPRVWGYYFDEVERTPEGWLIARRELRVGGQENFDVEWTPLVGR
jgi:hypothetical protein